MNIKKQINYENSVFDKIFEIQITLNLKNKFPSENTQ